jgi:hypothetical protein
MRETISYKDPSGYIVVSEGNLLRYLSDDYAEAYGHFMHSGLYGKLIEEQLLIPHSERDGTPNPDKVYKVLIPDKIDFITYPYEWCFSQWKDTLLACLKINRIALDYGMILKDATPFNFTLYRGKITLFDTSSFQLYREGEPWLAYKQFCEEFLGPLALMKYRHPSWSFLFSTAIRGFDLAFISDQLPMSSYLNMSCLLHLHMHAGYKNKGKSDKGKTSSGIKTGLNKQKLLLLWQMIERGVAKWKSPVDKKGFWSDYYADYIESQDYMADKKDRVTQWLERTRPRRVVDLGANTGVFSFIAGSFAEEVIAAEADPFCVEKLYQDVEATGVRNITSILADLTNPSAGLGWDNEERPALLHRLGGDMVMALALIHHLCITYNVPLDFVAGLLARLTSQYAIVEFIPKSDEKIRTMLKHREDIFTGYSEEGFRAAFTGYFDLQEEHLCQGSERKLFLWKRR